MSSLNDQPFSTSWTRYVGAELVAGDPCHHLEFLAETDLAAAGLGGPVERLRAHLYCRDDLQPISYEVTTRHAVNRAKFEAGAAVLTLPGGERQRVELDNFAALVGESVGQLAIYLRLIELAGQERHDAQLFSLAAVAVFGYQLRRDPQPDPAAGEGVSFESSLLEQITVDQDSWLVRLADQRSGVVTYRTALPLPTWREETILTPLPSYAPPPGASFDVVDVKIPAEETELGGSLTIPRGEGPYPTVVFIGGSGSHDRHGIAGPIDLGSHEVVDYLSERGWLGARFDTRGSGGTPFGGGLLELGYAEAVEDARAVVRYLRQHPAADPQRLVLVGHSQGALVAAELATQPGYARAVALLAAPARPIEQILREQIETSAGWTGQSAEQVELQLADLTTFLELVRRDVPWTSDHVPDRFLPYRRFRRWYAEVLARNPLDLLGRCQAPMLLGYGGKDFQVSAARDGQPAYEALRSTGKQVELAVFEDLDHLFKPVLGEPHISHYYDSSRHVDGAFLDRLERFLDAHVQ